MAIWIRTDDPKELLEKIKSEIQDGDIETWNYDEDGDFIHETRSGQWKGKAWLRPVAKEMYLVFNIVHPKSGLEHESYAVYHGRFIEMLVRHFHEHFDLVSATSNLTRAEEIE